MCSFRQDLNLCIPRQEKLSLDPTCFEPSRPRSTATIKLSWIVPYKRKKNHIWSVSYLNITSKEVMDIYLFIKTKDLLYFVYWRMYFSKMYMSSSNRSFVLIKPTCSSMSICRHYPDSNFLYDKSKQFPLNLTVISRVGPSLQFCTHLRSVWLIQNLVLLKSCIIIKNYAISELCFGENEIITQMEFPG